MLPLGLYDALRPWVLGGGAVLYLTFGTLIWRRSAWVFRMMYLLGGGGLAFYEFHMWWWVGILALLLVGVPLWAATGAAQQMPSSSGQP
jgi:hypothetical protein